MSVLDLVREDLRDFAGYASARRAKGIPRFVVSTIGFVDRYFHHTVRLRLSVREK